MLAITLFPLQFFLLIRPGAPLPIKPPWLSFARLHIRVFVPPSPSACVYFLWDMTILVFSLRESFNPCKVRAQISRTRCEDHARIQHSSVVREHYPEIALDQVIFILESNPQEN
jgi:hypothetical protein